MLALITLGIFCSVTLLAFVSLYPVLSRRDAVKERVARLMPQQEEEHSLLRKPKKWESLLSEMGSKVKTKPTEMRSYIESVTAAGFKRDAIYILLGAKVVLAVVLPAAFLILFALPRGGILSSTYLLIAAIFAISGYIMPTLWLDHCGTKRKTKIFHALPDVLDLLTICVEAGLSLDAAIIKTCENFQHDNCPLIAELNTVVLETRAGKARTEALKGLAERTLVDDIKGLVAMLVQTERFGTSLGKTLRTYSDSLRLKRKQAAEERAAKTAVKMLFPLIFCVFPALLIVMLVPAMFQLLTFLKH